DDDVKDDPGSNVEGANTKDEDVQEDYHEQMEGEQPEDDPQTKLAEDGKHIQVFQGSYKQCTTHGSHVIK
ncbi:hypothetical protein C0992_007897, partial [Termitomyces sp. T32_za158]